jgi:DNA-binding beta-propeller fold protein YncE
MRRICAAIIAMALLTLGSASIGVGAEFVTFYVVDRQPFGMVSDPTDGRVYVANSGALTPFGAGRISVIDPATNTVTSLDTTKPAGLLALDSAGRRLYSSNYRPSPDSVSLDVIDLDTGTHVTSFDGLGGLGVALDASRSRVFVAGGNYLARVDTTTFDIDVRMAPFGQSWFGVVTDPGLGRVYVTNISSGSPSLAVLDANDMHTLANISLPSVPRWALAVDGTTHVVYVAGSDPTGGTAAMVSSLDPVTFAMRTEPLGFHPAALALEPSAGRVWVTDATNNAIVPLDEETLLPVEPRTSLMEQPSFATFARDGLLYVAGYGGASVSVFRTAQSNQAPVVDGVVLSSASPRTNDSLTATATAHDPDEDSLTYTFTWTVNGAVVRTTTGPNASDSLDLSVAGNGDPGDAVTVSVVASDGDLTSELATAAATVANTAPTASVSMSDGRAKKQDVLTATVVASDDDGQALTYSYEWRVNGTLKHTSTGSSETSTFDLKTAGATIGDVVTVDVLVSDGTASATASTFAKITPAGH